MQGNAFKLLMTFFITVVDQQSFSSALMQTAAQRLTRMLAVLATRHVYGMMQERDVNNMPTDELCKIVLEFYTGGQIESSKTILYEACEDTEDEMMKELKQSNKHLNNESKIRRLLSMTRISISFTHSRYHQITKFLHCCDHRGKRFAEEFTAHQQVAVDECMIPFHGRMSFK